MIDPTIRLEIQNLSEALNELCAAAGTAEDLARLLEDFGELKLRYERAMAAGATL